MSSVRTISLMAFTSLLAALLPLIANFPPAGSAENSRIRAVYLAPSSQPQLSSSELEKHEEIKVVYSFEELQHFSHRESAIWINQASMDLVDPVWLHEQPQKYKPLIILGYSDALYVFRELLTGYPIEGPRVDWSTVTVEGGFSVWKLQTDRSLTQAGIMKGYDLPLSVEAVMTESDRLLDNLPPR